MTPIATTLRINQVSLRNARIIPGSSSVHMTITALMELISPNKNTYQLASSRPGQTGQSSTSPTTKAMPPMAGPPCKTQPLRITTKIKRRADSSTGNKIILTTTEARAMATTRPAIA